MRIGIGFDVHKLVTERNLIVGGVKIPFNKGLLGHSDADVLTHAIIDALLGAAGFKDIGTQFPPGDPRYKDISSLVLLGEIKSLVKSKGLKINNIDATIVAENPRMASFVDAMRQNISQTLEINIEQIMVKATTTDGIGSIGKGEGIAAYSVVTINSK
jgi:2-C-methyl-D-erythritol 2,4-cyclodiphosphate synthase